MYGFQRVKQTSLNTNPKVLPNAARTTRCTRPLVNVVHAGRLLRSRLVISGVLWLLVPSVGGSHDIAVGGGPSLRCVGFVGVQSSSLNAHPSTAACLLLAAHDPSRSTFCPLPLRSPCRSASKSNGSPPRRPEPQCPSIGECWPAVA